MLKAFQLLFSIITIALAVYGLITGNYQFQPYMILSLGLTMLVFGLHEYKRKNKARGWMLIFAAVFSILAAAIQLF